MSAPVSVPDRPYLTITDIVNTGLTSRTTIWREIKRGHLDAIQIGRSVRIPRESFDRWVDAHRIKAEINDVVGKLTDDERLELMSMLAVK